MKINNEKIIDRNKISKNTNIIGIIVNVFLFAVKFTIGIISHSGSIIADSYNNLTDSASNIISMIGVHLANEPADKDHPFGHGRIEYISAFIVAILVLQVGLNSFIDSIKKFFSHEELNISISMALVLLTTIIVKVLLGFYYKYIAKKISSNIFRAASVDSFSDVIITTGTLLSSVLYIILKINIDTYLSVIISIIIIYNGIKIARETLAPLIGEHIDEKLYKKIESFVKKYDMVEDTHDLIIHNYGPDKYMCSIHCEVDKTKDIEDIHEVMDQIEKDIQTELGLTLVIHMDPVDLHNENTLKYKNIVINTVDECRKENDTKLSSLSCHDIRCVYGVNNTNIIFDLVVPVGIDKKFEGELINRIKNRICSNCEKVSVVINIDKAFF